MSRTHLHIDCFKRELRVHDHAPLAEARATGPVLPLHIAEPGLWSQPDATARQWAFVTEALQELREALAAMGEPLVVPRGEACTLLFELPGRHSASGRSTKCLRRGLGLRRHGPVDQNHPSPCWSESDRTVECRSCLTGP